MDFFGAQDRARQQSRLLSLGFAACMLGVILILDSIALTMLRVAYATGRHPDPLEDSLTLWAFVHPGTTLLTSLLIGGSIGAASVMRMLQLRQGGGYVVRGVGGVRVERDAPDARRRLLHNVVSEMSLASGVPMPEVYVLEHDDTINAFVAGHTPASSAVAVTRGALQNLNRDQLQGVIAHEFSHILNGDMRLSMRLMGLVFGLMSVALAGRFLMRLSVHSSRAGWIGLLLGLGVSGIGQFGLWAGRILQAWISRKRECLADASAVQFTRNPEGLRNALIRAAALGNQSRPANPALEEVAHMLFLPGPSRWFSTHPPLLERVQALDPHVNQAQLESILRRTKTQWQKNLNAIAAETAAIEQTIDRAATAMQIAAGTGVSEYARKKLAVRALSTRAPACSPHGSLSLQDREAQLGVVFAVLAQQGARDLTQARQAYEAGIAPLLPRHRPPYSVIDDWVPLFDQSLQQLCALQITAKHLLIEGLERTVAHSDTHSTEEAELLRTIRAVLECPPPTPLPTAG